MIFPGGSRPRSQWGFRWSVAWLVAEVPVAGGRSPSLAPLPLGRPTRTSQRNPQPGPSRVADPEPCPRPTDAGEPTDLPGWLARQGEVRSQPTKVPRAPQAEGKLAPGSRTCPVGENTFWGDNPRGSQNFPPNSCDQEFQTGRTSSRDLEIFSNRARFPKPWTARDTGLSLPGRRQAGWLAGGSRPPLTEDPETQAGRPLGRPGDLGVSPFPGDQLPVPPRDGAGRSRRPNARLTEARIWPSKGRRQILQSEAESQRIAVRKLLNRLQHPGWYVSRLQTIRCGYTACGG